MAGAAEIERLAALLARLPGLGRRSSLTAVLHLLNNREQLLEPLGEALRAAAAAVGSCEICGNLDTRSPCGLCADPRRDRARICVVEEVADLWAVERAGIFTGLYHVLGGALSALDGVGPERLAIAGLVARAGAAEVREVILATNATVDGQTTAHYLADRLAASAVQVSRLALGVPVGSELNYLDEGTLRQAFQARRAP